MKALRLNPIRCDGFGYCAEIFAEHIRLDDWGFPILNPEPLSDGMLDLAKKAVSTCPRNALEIIDIPQERP